MGKIHNAISGIGEEVRNGVELQQNTPTYIARERKWAERGKKIRDFVRRILFLS